jgi:alpha-glucosidase (family GH31 glycosyl hydrolase)
VHGGQTISVSAPIDQLPLFVRAGSIVPLGAPVLSTNEPQALAKLRVYPGSDGTFTLYQDDGKTYGYEKGESKITRLYWADATGRLTREGAEAWSGPDHALLQIVGGK